MNTVNSDPACTEAQLHYCDFLNRESKAQIPERTLEHVAQCSRCQAAISRLKVLLARGEKHIDIQRSQKNSAISTVLRLHLAYIGRSVTCKTAKPFLPSLADPGLQINIPTPITAHVDNCQACADDLLTLRNLCLTQNQLYRLGQFFGEKTSQDMIACSQARAAIPSVVVMIFSETTAEVLKHLCACPDCRELLYQRRETVRMDLLRSKLTDEKYPCETIKATGIFDCVFPYGINPATNRYAKLRELLASHLFGCPTCLAKIQELHRTIYGIVERPDSEVVTRFTLQEQFQEGVERQSSDLYAEWPVKVQLLKKSRLQPETAFTTIGLPRRFKQRVLTLNLKQLLKLVAAPVAMTIIAIVLFFNRPGTKVVELGQIYNALEETNNLHISEYIRGKSEPIRERWLSRRGGITLMRNNRRFVLWDFANGIRKIRRLDSGTEQLTYLSAGTVARAKESRVLSFGLLPYSRLSAIPERARWRRLADEDVEPVVPGSEVYELTWAEKGQCFRKWRAFVNTQTKLVKKAGWYKKAAIGDEYILEYVALVEQPTDGEIKAVTQSTFN